MGSSAGSDSGGGGGSQESARDRAMGMGGKTRSSPSPSNNNNDNDNRREQYSVARTTTPIDQPVNIPSDGGIESPYVMSGGQRFAVGDPRISEATNVVDDRTSLEKGVDSIIDFYKQGGFLGAVVRGLEPASKAIQKKAMDFGLTTKINRLTNKKGSTVRENNIIYRDELTDLRNDLDAVREGTFTQNDYTKKYGSGDATNPLDASFNPNLLDDNERQNLENTFASELAYSIGNTTPQNSMVNQYFANMNMNTANPLSPKLESDYNAAKTSVNTLLGIVPTSQQFGYSTQPSGGFTASNLQTNPFNIEYLRTRGLI